MTNLKPEDLVGHLQILVTARRDAANRSAARVLDSADSATVTVNLSALEALLSLLADRARMEKALREAEEVLAVAALMPMVDPVHGDEVEALGIRIGFGALMSSAQASWRKRADIKGGEFVAGPCFATVVATLKTIRQALGATQ